MHYRISTGCFERGTEEQKAAFIQILGADNIQHKFDLYFHWYNIAHEYGHCLCDFNDNETVGLAQEMLVNRFAVSYWKARGFSDRLAELRAMLEATLVNFPCPVPEGETFIGWYGKIWGTEQLMSVPIYGYFQFKSVLLALDEASDFETWLKEAGIASSAAQPAPTSAAHTASSAAHTASSAAQPASSSAARPASSAAHIASSAAQPAPTSAARPEYAIDAASAEKVLADLMAFLDAAGIQRPDVCLELLDDPSQHFCRPV